MPGPTERYLWGASDASHHPGRTKRVGGAHEAGGNAHRFACCNVAALQLTLHDGEIFEAVRIGFRKSESEKPRNSAVERCSYRWTLKDGGSR